MTRTGKVAQSGCSPHDTLQRRVLAPIPFSYDLTSGLGHAVLVRQLHVPAFPQRRCTRSPGAQRPSPSRIVRVIVRAVGTGACLHSADCTLSHTRFRLMTHLSGCIAVHPLLNA